MKKLTIKTTFLLHADETQFLAGLTPNGPDVKYTAPDARKINNIYYRVLGNHHRSAELIEMAQKRKWPGGERKTNIQAQLEILCMLADLREAMKTDTAQDEPLAWLLKILETQGHMEITLASIALTAIETETGMFAPATHQSHIRHIEPSDTPTVQHNGAEVYGPGSNVN